MVTPSRVYTHSTRFAIRKDKLDAYHTFITTLINKLGKYNCSYFAEEKGIERLKETIISEKENFEEEKIRIMDFDENVSLHNKIEAIDLESRMKNIKKASLSAKQSGEQIMLKSLF